MKKPFVLLDYHFFTATELDTFCNGVKTAIYGNPTLFPSPPVSEIEFNAAEAQLFNARADYKRLGFTMKDAYTAARTDMMDKVDQNAIYVDSVAQGSRSTIAAAGFKPSKDQFERVEHLEKIEAFTTKPNGVSGQIVVEVPAINKKGAITFGCFAVEGGPLNNTNFTNGQIIIGGDTPVIHQDVNKSRRKLFQNLKPGVQYFFYVYASNSSSVSPLSDPKAIFVM